MVFLCIAMKAWNESFMKLGCRHKLKPDMGSCIWCLWPHYG